MSKEGSFFVFIDKGTTGTYELIPGARYKTTNLAVSKYQADARDAGVVLEAGDRVIIMNVSRVLNLQPAPGFKEENLDLDQLAPGNDASDAEPEAEEPKAEEPKEEKETDTSEVVLPDELSTGEGVQDPPEVKPAVKPVQPELAAPVSAGGDKDDDLFGDANDII